MFKLIPLYNTESVLKNWKHLSEGMEKVLTYSNNDTNMDEVLNNILSGKLLMWIGFDNNEYCGFVTTSWEVKPTIGKFLWIVHAYGKQGLDPSVLSQALNRLVKYAQEFKAKRVKFYTLRDKAWERKLKKHKFKPSYVEFIREV